LSLSYNATVSHGTVRRWCGKFGQQYADALRRRRPRPGGTWHPDEVFIKISSEQRYRWRAVDQDGNVLGILVQNRRGRAAARRFFRRVPKTTRTMPGVSVTDRLRSRGAAHREVMPPVEHRCHKGLNGRAESSQQPTRRHKRAMKGFRGVGGARRFPAAFGGISPRFRPRRHRMTAAHCRTETTVRFVIRDQITGAAGLPTAA
jgi:putative transposase